MIKMKASRIGWIDEIPEDWQIKRIKYILFELKNKANYLREEPLSITQDKGIIKSSETKVANPSLSYEGYIEVRKNDIVFNKYKAHSGVFFVSKYDGMCTFNYSVYRTYKNIFPKYYEYLFHTDGSIGDFKKNLHGVGESISPLYTKDLFALKTLCPSYEIQKRIADFLDIKCEKIDSLRNDIQKQIEILEQYKKSVITEAVTKGVNIDVKMKDSGSKWIPLVPEHWNMDKLKYNLTVHEIKGYGDKEVLSLYRELGIVPKNSRDDNHNVTSEDTSKYKYVRKGDFVINKMKAWQGSVAVSDFEGIVSPAYYVYEFINDKYDKKYFHHLMRNRILADEFRRISGGIREGQWDLDRVQFENMYLPVPPKNEQVEIANLIESKYGNIEKVIESKQQQLEKLEEYKKSLIFEYVTGKREV